MEDISKISDALLDLENGLSTLQDAVNKIEQAKETTVLAVNNTVLVQNSVDILVKQVIHLVNEIQRLDITSKMKRIESSIDTLEVDLQQTTHSIDSLGAALEDKFIQQTVDLEKELKASTNQLAERIETESKSSLKMTLAQIDSHFAKLKVFQIAQLIISVLAMVSVIFLLFRGNF